MRRGLYIAGCVLLVLGGLAVAAVAEPWPLVWCAGFPMAYAGALGIISEINKNRATNDGDNDNPGDGS